MMETMLTSSYHNRFIRQFDIPIGKNKRNSLVTKRVQRSAISHKVDEYGSSSNLDAHRGNSMRRNGVILEDKTALTPNNEAPKQEMVPQTHSPLMAYFGAEELESELPLNDMWLAQMLEGLNCCLKNEQALACPPATLYAINPVSSDKVDGTMRDDAIFNLLFLHKAFFSLSPATFCRAVHIVDQFIVRVKVKPKYMACVAAASYLIAAEFHEKPEDRPTAEELVNLTQCGGTVDDMGRMTTIIHSKLHRFVSGSTPMDYVKVFVRLINFIMKASREKNVPKEDPLLFSMSGEAQQRANNRILISLTSLQSREFSSACLALASLWLEWNGSKAESASNDSRLDALSHNMFQKLANLCQIPWDVLQQCANSVYKIYHICYNQALPCSREHLFWCLSRRTRNNLDNMSIRRCSGATRLQSISEEEEIATA